MSKPMIQTDAGRELLAQRLAHTLYCYIKSGKRMRTDPDSCRCGLAERIARTESEAAATAERIARKTLETTAAARDEAIILQDALERLLKASNSHGDSVYEILDETTRRQYDLLLS